MATRGVDDAVNGAAVKSTIWPDLLTGPPCAVENTRIAHPRTVNVSRRGVITAAALAAWDPWPANAQPARLERALAAGNVLPFLIGRWRFELAAQRGVREYRWLYRDHTIAYLERYHGREVEGRGLYQYSSPATYTNATFFNTGEHSIMEGLLDLDVREIRFAPMRHSSDNPIRAHLRLESDNAFSYHLHERNSQLDWTPRWVAVFRRD